MWIGLNRYRGLHYWIKYFHDYMTLETYIKIRHRDIWILDKIFYEYKDDYSVIYDFIHKNENTFERLENVILKMVETLNLKQDLLAINNNSLRIQKIAGIAVITVIALISLLGYKY